MENRLELPENYKKIADIDLQKNKKLALSVNLSAVVIAVLMIIPMCFHISIMTLFDMSKGFGVYILRFCILFAGIVVYMVLHELVHGVFIKYFSKTKPTYGFTGLYAFAGSKAYFNKKSYIIIALAPVVIWGVVLLVLNFLVPESWFWVVYIVQITNISGATGDCYVTYKMTKMPTDILVRDSGVSMEIYSSQN